MAPALQAYFGRHAQVLGRAPDGQIRLRVAAQSTAAVAEQLTGWALAVEVVEPQDVRAELARIGTELVGRYA